MKHTKKALVSASLALLLCFAMLVGTTFAWFTDSVTSAGNIIKSGKLNIDLGIKAAGDADYVSVKTNPDKKAFNYELWEPGYTEWVNAKVFTTGNLALKYTMKIVANGTVSDLADVIDVYYKAEEVAKPADRDLSGLTRIGTLRDALNGTIVINDTLIPGTNPEDFATLALHMQESAGNEYQDLAIGTSFSLQILATQYTYEADGFNDQYDAGAEYPVASQAEFTDALNAASASTDPVTIVLSEGNYTIPTGTTISNLTLVGDENTSVDTVNVASGATLTNLKADGITFISSNTNDWTGIISYSTLDGATFTNCVFSTEGAARDNNIYGPTLNNVTFDGCTIYGDIYGLNASYVNGTLTVKNCDITGWNSFGGAQNDSYTSSVVIENCTFHKSSYGVLRFYQNATVTNCVFDSNVDGIDCNASGKTISITGCEIKDVTTSAKSAVTVDFIHNNGSNTNTWILDGTDISSQVTSW